MLAIKLAFAKQKIIFKPFCKCHVFVINNSMLLNTDVRCGNVNDFQKKIVYVNTL